MSPSESQPGRAPLPRKGKQRKKKPPSDYQKLVRKIRESVRRDMEQRLNEVLARPAAHEATITQNPIKKPPRYIIFPTILKSLAEAMFEALFGWMFRH